MSSLQNPDYQETEQLKTDARERFEQSTNDDERKQAILMVIRSHYIRSKNTGIKNHPDFDTFVCHWLSARSEGWAWCPQYIIDLLAQDYPAPRRPRIAKGKSYWE